MSSELIEIKNLILEFLKDQEVSILLFGSRSRKSHHQGSDVDIGIIPRGGVDPKCLVLLREILENINIPYKVELIDFSTTSEDFRNEALKEAEWWRE